MKRLILLPALLASCLGDDLRAPMAPDGPVRPDAVSAVLDGSVPDSPPPDSGSACPALQWGTRPCADLAPECSGPLQPPDHEGGLHCLPGYESDPRVPCFCVGESTPDSWCLRDGGF